MPLCSSTSSAQRSQHEETSPHPIQRLKIQGTSPGEEKTIFLTMARLATVGTSECLFSLSTSLLAILRSLCLRLSLCRACPLLLGATGVPFGVTGFSTRPTMHNLFRLCSAKLPVAVVSFLGLGASIRDDTKPVASVTPNALSKASTSANASAKVALPS